MTSSTDTRTEPADIATRLHELELVMQAVITKLASIVPPDGSGDPSDLTDLWTAVTRLQRISLGGAHTGAVEPADVFTTTIFDGSTLDTSGSSFKATFGDNYVSKSLVANMGKGLAKSFYSQVFHADSLYPSIGRPLSIMAFGSSDDVNFDSVLNDANKSLCQAAFGNTTKLSALLAGTGGLSKTLYDRIKALETRMDTAEDDIADLQAAVG